MPEIVCPIRGTGMTKSLGAERQHLTAFLCALDQSPRWASSALSLWKNDTHDLAMGNRGFERSFRLRDGVNEESAKADCGPTATADLRERISPWRIDEIKFVVKRALRGRWRANPMERGHL